MLFLTQINKNAIKTLFGLMMLLAQDQRTVLKNADILSGVFIIVILTLNVFNLFVVITKDISLQLGSMILILAI